MAATMHAAAASVNLRVPNAGARQLRRARHTVARRASPTSGLQVSAASASPQKVLIVNTNGGGHANIGFWLSKTLASQGHQVTLCTVGTPDDKKMNKPPFTYLNELTSAGVKTVWGNPDQLAELAGGAQFDVVVDNNGKSVETVKPVADFALKAGAKQFLFVSSAGMYIPTPTPPHLEGDAVKESAGHAQVEAMLQTLPGVAMSSFRPQYFTGYGNNKDCEEYFFDRLVRGRPVCVPGSGDQLSVVAHAEDVATMMAAAVGNPAAAGQIFNAVTDKAVTLNGMVELCAAAAGVPANIVNYDPAAVEGVEVKKAFPFRPIHFYSYPAKALEVLDWKPTHSLASDLVERFAFYKASGRADAEMTFETDDKILSQVRR